MIAKNALKRKSKPLGSAFAAFVTVVAFPFEPAIAKHIKRVFGGEVHHLGGDRAALDGGPIPDVANFDAAVGGINAHVGNDTRRIAIHRYHGKRKRIGRASHFVDIRTERCFIGKRAIAHIKPGAIVAILGGKEGRSVRLDIERHQAYISALQYFSLWHRSAMPVQEGAEFSVQDGIVHRSHS